MISLVPEISLATEFFYINERDLYVFIGIELKSDLKRDIDFYLYVNEVTALGKPSYRVYGTATQTIPGILFISSMNASCPFSICS